MEYGTFVFVPICLVLVLAVLTRKTFESLLVGSLVSCIIMYQEEFLYSWVNIILDTLSDPDNQWIILMCGLFGSVIALLRESKGTTGFIRYEEKICKDEKSTLLTTFFLGLAIFIDDYLNMITIGACMREVYDKRKIPRESLAYIMNSTGTPLCVLLPFSTWAAFYGNLFLKEVAIEKLGFSSSIDLYIRLIPFVFYAIITIVMVMLFSLGMMPKLGRMKNAYRNVQANSDGGEYKAKLYAKEYSGNVLDMIIPTAVLIGCTVILDNILIAIILCLFVCFFLYVPRHKIEISRWGDLIIEGFASMLPTLAIIFAALVFSNCCEIMGLSAYVIQLVSPIASAEIYPLLTFVVVSVLAFATGSTWGMSAISVPILLPLGEIIGANPILTMAAILSGNAFGSHACFYSDATILASASADVDSMSHALSQFPYAMISAGLSCLCYLICGFLIH